MEKLEYTEELENIVNKDCKKIMYEIVELYNNKIEVNKSFNELVRERITPKYLYLIDFYYQNIIKLIPPNLYICPNHKWALVDEGDFNEIMLGKTTKNIDEKLNKKIKKIVNDLLNTKEIDFFDTLNKNINIENTTNYNSKYLIENIYNEIKKRGYTIISIDPFKISKD